MNVPFECVLCGLLVLVVNRSVLAKLGECCDMQVGS